MKIVTPTLKRLRKYKAVWPAANCVSIFIVRVMAVVTAGQVEVMHYSKSVAKPELFQIFLFKANVDVNFI